MRPAHWIFQIHMRERLPAATQAEYLDVVLAAAVSDGFDDRIKARNIAATSKDPNALLRHDRSLRAFYNASASGPSARLATLRVVTHGFGHRLGECLQPAKGGIRAHNDVGRDTFQIRAKSPFGLEAGTKF